MIIRTVQPGDRDEWMRMRLLLWPETSPEQHAAEIGICLAGRLDPNVAITTLVAERADLLGKLCGFIEISIKPLDGFETHPVGYIEGWYVDADQRRKGVGRALVAAAERWVLDSGCVEIGSGCDRENNVSRASHLAIGFRPIDDLIFFRKRLSDDSPTRLPTSADDWVELLDVPLRIAEVVRFASDVKAGGIDVFLGTTRAETHSDGRQLIALDYEAYDEMAVKQMRDLTARARERWPIVKLAILHRTGRVALAEPSVVIAVACAHRGEAFEACRWLIDTLKAEVAIWKKEVWSDGEAAGVRPTNGAPPTS